MQPKKSRLYKYMLFEINTEPFHIDSSSGFSIIDNEKIVKKYPTKSKQSLFYNLVMLCFPVFGSIYFFSSGPLLPFEFIIIAIVFIPFIVICTINVFFHLMGPDKAIIYDRLKGFVSLPDTLWGKQYIVPFTELEAVLSQVGRIQAPGLVLAARFPRRKWFDVFKPSIHIGFGRDPFAAWAFIVWYMDKNRPLPPGSAFDPYRTIDEQRRANEGYPSPLFPLQY
jgi:hypothetical protein